MSKENQSTGKGKLEPLLVAVSSRALFDLESENDVFEKEGLEAYRQLQREAEGTPARPGVAFNLVRKLLLLNTPESTRVRIAVISRNDPETGMRVLNSADHHGLKIDVAAFTNGEPTHGYARAYGANLFLSANQQDVKAALDHGIPSARVYRLPPGMSDPHPETLRIAFDGDAVLFSGESEAFFREAGLVHFEEREASLRETPMAPGPFAPFLRALHDLQQSPTPGIPVSVVTALVTARSSGSYRRALHTLRSWGIRLDKAFALAGRDKTQVLREFHPDFFFDDQEANCEPASENMPTGHVDSNYGGLGFLDSKS